MGVFNSGIGGDTGGRSVLGVAWDGDGGVRGLRTGTWGSSDGSPGKLRVWNSGRLGVGSLRGLGREEGWS